MTRAASPMPVAVIVGDVAALEANVRVEDWVPVLVGVNVTVMFWLPPAINVKLDGLTVNIALLLETFVTVTATVPLLVTWKLC